MLINAPNVHYVKTVNFILFKFVLFMGCLSKKVYKPGLCQRVRLGNDKLKLSLIWEAIWDYCVVLLACLFLTCTYILPIIGMEQLKVQSLRSFNQQRMLDSLKDKERFEFKISVPHRSLFQVIPKFKAASCLQKVKHYKIECVLESERLIRECAEDCFWC